jgi:hypothetical protein
LPCRPLDWMSRAEKLPVEKLGCDGLTFRVTWRVAG